MRVPLGAGRPPPPLVLVLLAAAAVLVLEHAAGLLEVVGVEQQHEGDLGGDEDDGQRADHLRVLRLGGRVKDLLLLTRHALCKQQ